MEFKKIVLSSVLCGIFFSPLCLAGGSIGFDDADKVLLQEPALRAYLLDTLCIFDGGMASRMGNMYPMGGLRLAPYELMAKPKGIKGDYTLQITVNAVQIFYKKNKKETNDYSKAVDLKETFNNVEISVLEKPFKFESERSVNCKD